jgi:hypothetical protein
VDTEAELQSVLTQAENRLASLVSRAIEREDFAAVERVAGVIRRLRVLVGDIQIKSAEVVPSSLQPPPSSPKELPQKATTTTAPSNPTGAEMNLAARPTATRPKTRVVGNNTYPQFRREPDGTLVKIGYSKSDRRRYEHRAPRAVLEQLAKAVADLGSNGRLISSEALLASHVSGLSGVPTYQIYLCLAFFVYQGLLLRQGRRGYTISALSAQNFEKAAMAKFTALTKR